MVALEKVYKSFRRSGIVVEVLKGIDLLVRPGESLAVMGASGAGKSTLLNILGTLEPPSSGAVLFDNVDVNAMEEGSLCRLRNRDIGFVFQFHHLLPEFDALENTIMPALIARFRKREAVEMAREMLHKVGLEKRMNHRVGELSGGEQQRVAIARALIMKPRLLLADEPTGNLDRITGEGITDLLSSLNREEGLTMIIATHNQQLAERMLQHMEIVDGRIR